MVPVKNKRVLAESEELMYMLLDVRGTVGYEYQPFVHHKAIDDKYGHYPAEHLPHVRVGYAVLLAAELDACHGVAKKLTAAFAAG